MRLCIRSTILLALILVLPGCGVQFVYPRVDSWTVRWIDRQVDLEQEQKLNSGAALNRALVSHCRTALPGVAGWIRELQSDFDDQRLDFDQFDYHADRLDHFWRDLLQLLEPVVLELLTGLSSEQIERLLGWLEDQEHSLAEDLEKPLAERRDQWFKGLKRNLSRLLGPLSVVQEQRLREWSQALLPLAELTLEERRHWRQRLSVALAAQDRQRLAGLFDDLVSLQRSRSEDYVQRRSHNRALTLQALTEIADLASTTQSQRLQRRLSAWAQGFERLDCNRI